MSEKIPSEIGGGLLDLQESARSSFRSKPT